MDHANVGTDKKKKMMMMTMRRNYSEKIMSCLWRREFMRQQEKIN
jgi:hypothetical protein